RATPARQRPFHQRFPGIQRLFDLGVRMRTPRTGIGCGTLGPRPGVSWPPRSPARRSCLRAGSSDLGGVVRRRWLWVLVSTIAVAALLIAVSLVPGSAAT